MARLPIAAAEPDDRLVLCYHGVSDTARAKLTVPGAVLRRQLSTLRARGYVPVTFQQAVGSSERARRLAVTFDDAEANVLHFALPLLAEFGMPGTVFVPVDQVGGRAMSWDDLGTLAGEGWEIGSHTLSHSRLCSLDETSLERELRGSREAIEDALGSPCRSIAYPYGEVNERVRAAASRCGFVAGCTTRGTLRATDPLLCPRVGIDGRDGVLAFRAKTSRVGRGLRGSPLGRGLMFAGRAGRSAAALQFVLRQK